MACSAVLFKFKIVQINILPFRHEKVINHGSRPQIAKWLVLGLKVLIFFEKKCQDANQILVKQPERKSQLENVNYLYLKIYI